MLLKPIIIVTLFKTVTKVEFLFLNQKLCVENTNKKVEKDFFFYFVPPFG